MQSREALLESLRGEVVVIPDLYRVFTGWVPVVVNPYYRKLMSVSDERLESIYSDKRKLSALKASDFAFFAATWWPKARYEELRIMLYLTIWLFTWDDEIDEPSGSYSEDFQGAERYRTQTIEFVLECLGFRSDSVPAEATNRIIASFRDIGEPLANAYTLDQRKRFMDEITRFLEHSKHEQEIRLSNQIPSVKEYWSFRMGTSAVGIAVAALEYSTRIHIPDDVMRDPRIQTIADETIIIISIVNDLLSLKKEIAKGCIDSVVPIYCSEGMGVQGAVNEAVEALQASKDRFDVAAGSLMTSSQREPSMYKNVSDWIDGCQSYCMGNLVWSLATGRYGVNKCSTGSDGSLEFTL